MGNGADFFARDYAGRRSEYTSIMPAVTVNGVKGHVIKKVGDSDTHTNLPFYANTSDVYFRQGSKGICQARVYIGQKLYLDFDWSHHHTNKGNGHSFKKELYTYKCGKDKKTELTDVCPTMHAQ